MQHKLGHKHTHTHIPPPGTAVGWGGGLFATVVTQKPEGGGEEGGGLVRYRADPKAGG